MTARIHVIAADPILAQSLCERLSAQLYHVAVGHAGNDLLAYTGDVLPDLIIIGQRLSDMDGYAFTHNWKRDSVLSSIPVLLLAERSAADIRVKGLQAGVDDFLTLPLDEAELTIRVKNLLRLGTVANEVRERCDTAASIGIRHATPQNGVFLDNPLRIGLITEQETVAECASRFLKPIADVILINSENVLFLNDIHTVDLILATISGTKELTACQTLRACAQTRHVPILGLVPPDNDVRVQQYAQLGLSDCVALPLDQSELIARSLMQMRGKRLNDLLKSRIEETENNCVIDAVTGLPNQTYLENHLARLIKRAHARSQTLTVSIIRVPELLTQGAQSDRMAQSISKLLKTVVRGADLVSRIAQDRFVLVMPDTLVAAADSVLERLKAVLEAELELSSIAFGRAELNEAEDTVQTLLTRALPDVKPSGSVQADDTLKSCV